MREADELMVSAPGRICLFGEHQDYLGLPIIAAAINLRIFITGSECEEQNVKINLPDTKEIVEFPIEKEIGYRKERDYLRSGFNILRRRGLSLSSGWDCLLRGTIPINAGSASSSALVVAWIKFLLEASRHTHPAQPEDIAELGFMAEVAEFREPGGRMDHYSSALGGVLSIHFLDKLEATRLKNSLGEFVLSDSLQKKDTTGMLGYIKNHVLRGAEKVKESIEDFNLLSPHTPEIEKKIDELPPDERRLLRGTLLTRDITAAGEALFAAEDFDHERFGELLSAQYEVLKKHLNLTTPKLEHMFETSLKAGALGAKINGSGGGGCIFAYAPRNARKVAQALEQTGAKTYIIRVDEGVRKEKHQKL